MERVVSVTKPQIPRRSCWPWLNEAVLAHICDSLSSGVLRRATIWPKSKLGRDRQRW